MLKCRKCNGSHLTIKCGIVKETIAVATASNATLLTPSTIQSNSNSDNRLIRENNRFTGNIRNNNIKTLNNKKYITIKIANLPEDMSDEEMYELVYDWGTILKLRVLKYTNISVAYVDFKYSIEADYFIQALDKTPFEYMILDVTLAN